MKKATFAEIHNRVAPAVIDRIVTAVMQGDGADVDKGKQIMVITESVIVGIAGIVIGIGGDEKVLDVMLASAKERLAVMRLSQAEPAGTA